MDPKLSKSKEPAMGDKNEDLAIVAEIASRVALSCRLADNKGTMCFAQFSNLLETELSEALGNEYSFEADWRVRWKQIIRGSRTVQFKYAWLHDQYAECDKLGPFTDRWWNRIATPIRLKYLRGSAAVALDSDARGFPLPSDFAETLVHYTLVKHLPSITKLGLRTGVNSGKSTGNCVHLSSADYDPDHYKRCEQQFAQGDLELPHRVGYPPKELCNIMIVVSYGKLFALGPELCQDEGFSITCKAGFDIPWQCLEAAFDRDTNSLIWVNPEYYDKYLLPPDSGNAEPFNTFGTGASSSSAGPMPTSVENVDVREETRGDLTSRINKMILNKSISDNCSMCPS